jgi:multidrug efflux pump subunit AcrA (membrane-fusion protein)
MPLQMAVTTPATETASDAPVASAAQALQLQAAVLAFRDFQPAATAFVTELARHHGCLRATLGFARRKVFAVVAVSGGGPQKFAGDDFAAIADAMDEARQQSASVHVPADGATRSLVTLAHGRLRQRHGGAVATLPILQWGEVVGAVTLEWSAPPPDLPGLVHHLETTVNLVGPVLDLMRRRDKPFWLQLPDGLRSAQQGLAERPVLRYGLLAALVALPLLTLLPVPHDVGGQAHVEGEQQRTLVAPADGFLKVVHVRPGDTVRRDQVLAEMATDDLLLQQRKWQSEFGQQEHAYASALAQADRAAMVIALARTEQARAQLALVEMDLSRSSIVAPFDGVVLQGDLVESVGAPFERGKPMLVLAPGDAQRVVVAVDERDVARVQPGQKGQLALSALPWEAIGIEVVRVTPVARVAEGRNVFEVEAKMDAAATARVRPGLQGAARIEVGSAPLLWIWTHRAIETTRLAFWRWWI